eukprot:355680-Chlamydomonas_euryale.AAC.2
MTPSSLSRCAASAPGPKKRISGCGASAPPAVRTSVIAVRESTISNSRFVSLSVRSRDSNGARPLICSSSEPRSCERISGRGEGGTKSG